MIFFFDEDGEPSSRTIPSLGEDIVHLWSTTSLQAPFRLARFRKSNILGDHYFLIPAEVWSQIPSYVNEKDPKSIVVANFPHASQQAKRLFWKEITLDNGKLVVLYHKVEHSPQALESCRKLEIRCRFRTPSKDWSKDSQSVCNCLGLSEAEDQVSARVASAHVFLLIPIPNIISFH
jgi:hypothetical protein